VLAAVGGSTGTSPHDTMTAEAFLDASAYVEQAAVGAAAGIGVLALVAAVARSRRAAPAPEIRMPVPVELALLALVLTVAVLTRTVGYDSGLTAPASLSALTPLEVGKMLADGTFRSQWLALCREFQSGAIQNSAMLLPVAAAFQVVLGPSLHLPLVIGAFYGVAAVVLAWAFGRVAVSSAFGVVFAALIAISPLQIVWARLGGVHITVVAHVLLAAWCGYLAGKRGSPTLAALTGVVVWASLYQYAAARIAMLIAPAMLIAGATAAHLPIRRTLLALLVTGLTVVVIFAVLRPDLASLWPAYPGYVGNKGERSAADLVTQNLAPIKRQLELSFGRYFLTERAVHEPTIPPYRFGMQFGGLCLVPVTILGLLGLVAALRHPLRTWPLFLLAAAGIAVPVLSVTTARRLLLFDLAWCAFASVGVLLLVRASVRVGASMRAAAALVVVMVIAIGSWSFASVVALNQALPGRHLTPLPFGESGFGDGMTCVRCQRAGYEWRDEIARGAFVVLFDADLDRENIGVGGLTLYGRVAALSVDRPRSFLDFYPVMRNLDLSRDNPGRQFDATRQDFASYMRQRIEAARPATIVWHFESPTQWERWLARRLVDAGGTAVEFETPLSRERGLQVRTEWAHREAAYRVLADLVAREQPADVACSSLRVLEKRDYPVAAMHLGVAADGSGDRPPEWIVGSWDRSMYGSHSATGQLPVGADVETDANGVQHVRILTRQGQDVLLTEGDAPQPAAPQPGAPHLAVPDLLGLDCGVRIGTQWWGVDPTSGTLLTTGPAAAWIPDGRWIAITRDGPRRLVLGSAEQSIVVFDMDERAEVARFPAAIAPSRRTVTNECSRIVVGAGWYGTFDSLTSIITLYERTGRPLGSHDLGRLPGSAETSGWIQAVAASGNALAVAHGTTVVTVAVDIDPQCATRASKVGGA
jgi:hypothetical protein